MAGGAQHWGGGFLAGSTACAPACCCPVNACCLVWVPGACSSLPGHMLSPSPWGLPCSRGDRPQSPLGTVCTWPGAHCCPHGTRRACPDTSPTVTSGLPAVLSRSSPSNGPGGPLSRQLQASLWVSCGTDLNWSRILGCGLGVSALLWAVPWGSGGGGGVCRAASHMLHGSH